MPKKDQAPTAIRERPARVKAFNAANWLSIHARHPWLRESKFNLNIGVSKLRLQEREDWLNALQRLVDKAPRVRDEAPDKIPQRILDLYFDKLDAARAVEMAVTVDRDGKVVVEQGETSIEAILPNVGQAIDLMKDFGTLKRDLSDLRREHEAMRRQRDELLRKTGQRLEREETTTLGACLEHFEKHFSAQSKRQTKDVKKVVRTVIEKVGLGKMYSSTRAADVNKVLAGLANAATRTKYAANVKRFFKFLTRKEALDGLGFSVENSPVDGITYDNPKKLARKRRAAGRIIAATDPTEVLLNLDSYWRGVYATLCYAGLRPSELARLKKKDVDESSRLIHVTGTKSELSYRPVKPFKEFWSHVLPVVQERQQEDDLIFPRPAGRKQGQSWFRTNEEVRMGHFTRALKRVLKKAGLTSNEEPSRRARRYWDTRLRMVNPSLIPIMGGHTDQVSLDHYADARRILSELKDDNNF